MNLSIFKTIKLPGRVTVSVVGHCLVLHLASLLVILLFDWGYPKLAGLLVILLFNLNSLIHSRLDNPATCSPTKLTTDPPTDPPTNPTTDPLLTHPPTDPHPTHSPSDHLPGHPTDPNSTHHSTDHSPTNPLSTTDPLTHPNEQPKKRQTEDQTEDQTHQTVEWLQAIIDQLWSGELVASFQRELNKFYIKNRNTEFKFYHFYLNESRAPKLDQIYVPAESTRTDEIVLHLRTTLIGTALLKLKDESEQDKAESGLVARLVQQYGFRRKSQTGTYQDAKLKKKKFLVKEFYLSGRARIVLRPLCIQAPFFTSLQASLLDHPTLHSNDQRDLAESSDEFEHRLYNYLVERICLPFLSPNRLVLLYAHRDFIKREHGKLLRQKLSETNQFMRTKLRRLIKSKRKSSDFAQELFDHKIIDWYRANVVRNLDLVELELNCSTYHPPPLFICRLKVIEADNLLLLPNCVMFVRIQVGQLSLAKVRVLTSACPLLNLTALLPVHDFYEAASVQMFEIRSQSVSAIKRCTTELAKLHWNQPIAKLPKTDPLIRPLSEASFDLSAFAEVAGHANLNGQDFWLPLEGARAQSMVHLSCACFRLSAAPRTLRKVSRVTRSMMISKNDLNHNQLPVAFVKLYAENFVCTYSKDNKLRSRRNQFNQLAFSLMEKTKTVDRMKLTKTRSIFRNGCHFFAYDDPFKLELLVELGDRKRTGFVHENDNPIRLLNLISLADFKGRPSLHNQNLSIYIVNNKDFPRTADKQFGGGNFKTLDKEEYGVLAMNLFIGYVCLEGDILRRLFMAPEIRGQTLDGGRGEKKPEKLTKKDKNQLLGMAATADTKKSKSLRTGECVGRLYFKLVNAKELMVGVVNVVNVPHDSTKRVRLQVAVELWKGNRKVTVKKTPFTEIVHNPTFDSSFQFAIESGNLQQYAVRFVVVQRSGLFRSALKIIADRFCTIPLLTLDANFVIRSYRLKSDKQVDRRNVSSKNQFNFK